MPRVQAYRGGAWSPAVVGSILGTPPLDVRPVTAPIITVDGLVERDATDWLAHVAARTGGPQSTRTAESYAESLRLFIDFLVQRRTTLRGATRRHIVDYVNYRTVEVTRVSGNTWTRDRTTIKQFYEWLREEHGVEPPITIDYVRTPRGTVSSMREGRNLPKASAAGTPLEPPQLDELLAAALTYGANRTERGGYTGVRDAALIALGAACGGRADTLAHLTVYEIPPAVDHEGDLTAMILPGAIAKTRREVRLPAFTHHLDRVRRFIDPSTGARRHQLSGWKPANPIRIAQEPTPRFHGIVDTDGVRRPFRDMTADERRRLLTPSGEPAMIFLTFHTGKPLAAATTQEITGDVSAMAERDAALHGRPFPHVHTHDLRHTYATHLAAVFYFGVPTAEGTDMRGRPRRVDVRSAVSMASAGLGHVNERTTALYIQQVGVMSRRYTTDDFLGRGTY